MTIEEFKLRHKTCKRYIDKKALILGSFFIFEYIVRCKMFSNQWISYFILPLAFMTPVLIFVILRSMRDKYCDGYIYRRVTWIYGNRLMLLSALVEAFFIYIYNEFIAPDNLASVQSAMASQLESSINEFGKVISVDTLTQYLSLLKETPIPSAIEAAKDSFISTLFYGCILILLISFIVKGRPKSVES